MALRGKGTNAVGAAAVDYLRLFALVAYGWMWVRMATAAAGDTPQHNAKRAVADYFVERMLPPAQALAASVAAGEATTMALPAESFCAGAWTSVVQGKGMSRQVVFGGHRIINTKISRKARERQQHGES